MTKTKYTSGGTNILRGGKRTYTCKTLLGNFVEETYRPDINIAGFSGGDIYVTTNKAQMLEGANVAPKLFGAALRSQQNPNVNSHNIIGPDLSHGSSTWVSVTRSAHSGNNNNGGLEFNGKHRLVEHKMSSKELQEYRDRWTKETDVMKKQRFVTENSVMQSKYVADPFKRSLVREN